MAHGKKRLLITSIDNTKTTVKIVEKTSMHNILMLLISLLIAVSSVGDKLANCKRKGTAAFFCILTESPS